MHSYLSTLPTDIHVEIVKKLPKDYTVICERKGYFKYICIKDLLGVTFLWSRIDICYYDNNGFDQECKFKFELKADQNIEIYHQYIDPPEPSTKILHIQYIDQDNPDFNKWKISSQSTLPTNHGFTSICVLDDQLKKILSKLNIDFDLIAYKSEKV
ncbi:MAG: hypothetical protein Dasosvirus20_4, partial [Dasosvirus sp.]